MNKVLGLGLGCAVADEDLDAIEDFYDEHGSAIQIELCPLASADLASRLSARGYALKGFENELACALPVTIPIDGSLRVEVASSDADTDTWLRVTTEGFATPDGSGVPVAPSPETMQTISGIMRSFIHHDIVRYLVVVDGGTDGA